MANDLKHLLPHHMRILDLTLEGIPRPEIASLVDMTPQQISNIQNSPVFQDELARRRERRNDIVDRTSANALVEAKEKLTALSVQAVEVLESHLGHQDARVQQSAAKDILDRVLKKDGNESQSIVLNDVTIQVLIAAMKESR